MAARDSNHQPRTARSTASRLVKLGAAVQKPCLRGTQREQAQVGIKQMGWMIEPAALHCNRSWLSKQCCTANRSSTSETIVDAHGIDSQHSLPRVLYHCQNACGSWQGYVPESPRNAYCCVRGEARRNRLGHHSTCLAPSMPGTLPG